MASVSTKGQRYIGETRNQMRHGYGVYKYCNKFFKYEGEWKEGKKHGHGKLLMSDGSYYEGEFINGEIEGHGFRKWATSRNTYSGQFYNGELHGHGVMNYGLGGSYEGEWQHNRRQGHGVLKLSDGTHYEGSFHNNIRHGEGSQTYVNKDQYVGDWIMDRRQGSGELRCNDGTIYDGQWRNDMFNGQGTMIHCSGMVYEGMWINDKPAQEAAEIVILGEQIIELQQGQPFTIEVEVRTADGEVVDCEQNRRLRVSAGFKHYVPNQGMPLFDLIEEMEEIPIPTPYGYEVVAYPLTDYDNLKEKLSESVLKPSTAATDALTVVTDAMTADNVSVTLEEDGEGEAELGPEVAPSTEIPPSTAAETTIAPSEMTGDEISESPLPPPVDHRVVEKGKAEFLDLYFPGVSPSYLPFVLAEFDKGPKKSKSVNKMAASEKERETPTDELHVKSDQFSVDKLKDFKLSKAKREKYYGDLRYARPGEYVIMVDDITEPPFRGFRLPTAFCLVRIAFPKKTKKVTKSKKDSKSSTKLAAGGD
ncbi:MORN repeat-containing protein 1-like isoform X6 [Lytechinus variegatus]|uniref:MORN repeat-containing protein 1-like isoform X6 n=1 Tax=Lytechinus variegatus TaxID=7654 RepID=UPI001BB22169|nr:MORN repeat-containing protein 1-like isoform X6 [Lytechinus variegatus]